VGKYIPFYSAERELAPCTNCHNKYDVTKVCHYSFSFPKEMDRSIAFLLGIRSSKNLMSKLKLKPPIEALHSKTVIYPTAVFYAEAYYLINSNQRKGSN